MAVISRNADYTAVSNVFIDDYLTQANAEFVRVYIFALRNCGREMTNAGIAESLNILESDVIKAWDYWSQAGIVAVDGDSIQFLTVSPKPKKVEIPEVEHKISRQEVAEKLQSDPTLKMLNDDAQKALGKPLSPNEILTLYSLYTFVQLPEDVISMLIRYCKAMEKTSFKYIEKVAISWKERGITTIEAVDALCISEDEMRKNEGKIKKALNIRTDRKLTDSEKKYIDQWTKELGFGSEVIGLAYDQTVLNTGKLSWAYLNTVLRNWHKKGLKSKDAISAELDGRSKKNKFDNFDQDDFDMAELEKAAMRRRIKEQGGV